MMNNWLTNGCAQGMKWRRIERTLFAVFVLAAIAGTALVGYYRLFSEFHFYDDEGYMMIRVKHFLAGERLFDDVPSTYGPTYYYLKYFVTNVLGVPLTHDGTRFTTLALWLASALACGAYVLCLTRAFWLAALAYVFTFYRLGALVAGPGHPQEVGLALVSLSLLVSCGSRLPRGLLLGLLGCLAVLAALTKVNIGVFAGMALVLATVPFLPRGAWRSAVWLCAAVLSVAVAPSLMWMHFDTPWALWLCAAVTTGLTLSGVAGGRAALPGQLAWRVVVALLLVVLMAGIGAVAWVARDGSILALLTSVALAAARFPEAMYRPGIVPSGAPVAILLSGVLFGCHAVRNRLKPRAASAVGFAVLGAKCAASVLTVLWALSFLGGFRMLFFTIPFAWLFLIPRDVSHRLDFHAGFPRVYGVLLAVAHALIVYPICGPHIQWATFLFMPVACVGLWDSIPAAAAIGRRFVRLPDLGPLPALARMAVLVILLLRIVAFSLPTARDHYRHLSPLNLPGADRLRLDAQLVGQYQWLVQNLDGIGLPFSTVPPVNSLYFWTRTDLPRVASSPRPMWYWNQGLNSQAIELLSRGGGYCLVGNPEITAFWDDHATRRGVLTQMPADDVMVRVLQAGGGWNVFVSPDVAPPAEYLLCRAREFRQPRDAVTLSYDVISKERSVTVGGWFRTTSQGTILGAQEFAPFDKAPAGAAVNLVMVGADGLLRAGYGPSSSSLLSKTPLNDGGWHHAALAIDSDKQTLFIDGKFVATHVGPALDRHKMNYAQLGLGCVDHGGGCAFVGEMGGWIVHPSFWREQDADRVWHDGPLGRGSAKLDGANGL